MYKVPRCSAPLSSTTVSHTLVSTPCIPRERSRFIFCTSTLMTIPSTCEKSDLFIVTLCLIKSEVSTSMTCKSERNTVLIGQNAKPVFNAFISTRDLSPSSLISNTTYCWRDLHLPAGYEISQSDLLYLVSSFLNLNTIKIKK